MEWPFLHQYFDTSLFVYYPLEHPLSTLNKNIDLWSLKSVVFNEPCWRHYKIIRDKKEITCNFIPTFHFASTIGVGCLDTEPYLDYTYLQIRSTVHVAHVENYGRPRSLVPNPIDHPFYAGQFGLGPVNQPAFPLSNLAGYSIGYRMVNYMCPLLS